MNTTTSLVIIAVGAISLVVMGSIGTFAVDTAVAQNTTAGATDTSNMTTFEENATFAGNNTASGGMANSTALT